MNKIIIISIVFSVFVGYAHEFTPNGITMTFPFSNRTLISDWYWFILFKDIRSVFLVWAVWHMIPNNEYAIKLSVTVFAIMLTFIPIYFILFYSAPFHAISFGIKLAVSIIIGFLITYNNDRMRNSTNTRSDYS